MTLAGQGARIRSSSGLISLLAIAALLNVLALRGVWRAPVALPGQFLQGFFEDHGDVVGLTLDEQQQDRFLPNLSLTHDRRIDLPPGTNVGVLLQPDTTYEIAGGEKGLAPYLVFGRAVEGGGTDLRVAAATGPPYRLVDAVALGYHQDGAALRPWDASLPYRADQQRLRAVADGCLGGVLSAPVTVARIGEKLSIRFANCTLDTALPEHSEDAPYYMAVMAGLQWHSVAMRPGGFRVRRVFESVVFGYVALLAIVVVTLLALSPGFWTPLAASLGLAVASLFMSPVLCAALFVSIGLVGLLTAPLSLVLRLVRHERRGLRFGLAALSYTGIAIAVAWALGASVERAAPPVDAAKLLAMGPQPRCVLIGYSTADDVQVRRESPGTWRHLSERCGSCQGGVRKYALTSETFPRMHSFVCSPVSALAVGEPVIFLGASNDDFSSWAEGPISPWSLVARNPYVVTSLYYLLRNPSSSRLRSGMDHRASLSVASLDTQLSLIRDAVRCAVARGARFLYVHDLLVLDLDGSRSQARRQMLAGRRDVVTQAGGRFVDLYEAFGDVMGVSWFNDMIHLSSVGHRHVAERVCQELRQWEL